MKTKTKILTSVSRVLTVFTALCLLGLGIALPWVARWYLQETAHLRPVPAEAVVLVFGYAAIATGLLCCGLMGWILRRVDKNAIFHRPSAAIIRWLGISCFFETVVFGVMTAWFPLSAVVAFAALFLGVALLVVSNVIGAATVIKEENDYTV